MESVSILFLQFLIYSIGMQTGQDFLEGASGNGALAKLYYLLSIIQFLQMMGNALLEKGLWGQSWLLQFAFLPREPQRS